MEQVAVLFLRRILNGDMSPAKGDELPQQGDSELVREAKEIGMCAIEASCFIGELSSGNLSVRAPVTNPLLGTSKELQSVLRHLLWTIECISKGDYRQSVDFLGDFSRCFNLFIKQIELREVEQKEHARLERKTLEQKNYMLHELLVQQLEHYNSLSVMYKTVRGLKHDMKNHCFALNELLNQGDILGAQKYLSQISSRLLLTKDNVYNTGNPIFDALLNDKVSKAKSLGICVSVQLAMGARELSVSHFVWCVILGNTLDNAIEACQRLGTEQKQIWINAQVRRDMFHLSIKNSSLPPVFKEDGGYATSKADQENHGIGLRNVREAIEQYDGVIQTEFKDGFFTIGIMLFGV